MAKSTAAARQRSQESQEVTQADVLQPSLPSVRIPMDDLVPDPVNPRKGRIADLVAALREFGQHRDAVVKPLADQPGKYKILIGNHMHKAAAQLGWEYLDCKIVDDDDLKALRRALSDNRIADRAGWDEDVLRDVVRLAGDDIPGFDDSFMEKLFKEKDDSELDGEPMYPITPRFGEEYHAVVICSKNATDWAFLQTVLQLQRSRSYKNTNVGLCQVVTAERFAELWREHGGEAEDRNRQQGPSGEGDNDQGGG